MTRMDVINILKSCDSLVPTKAIGASTFFATLVGALFLLPYYQNINYIPILDFSSFVYVLGYAFITGFVMTLVLVVMYVLPGYFLFFMPTEKQLLHEKIFISEKKKVFWWSYSGFILPPLLVSGLILLLIIFCYDFWLLWLFLLTLLIPYYIIFLKKWGLSISARVDVSFGMLMLGLFFLASILYLSGILSILNEKSDIENISGFLIIAISVLLSTYLIPFMNYRFGYVLSLVFITLSAFILLHTVLGFGTGISKALIRNADLGAYTVDTIVLKYEGCLTLKVYDKNQSIKCKLNQATSHVIKINVLSSLGKELYLETGLSGKKQFIKLKRQYLVSLGREVKVN